MLYLRYRLAAFLMDSLGFGWMVPRWDNVLRISTQPIPDGFELRPVFLLAPKGLGPCQCTDCKATRGEAELPEAVFKNVGI